jgi:hypothetical protein
MRYDEYLRLGYGIGSGAVESVSALGKSNPLTIG